MTKPEKPKLTVGEFSAFTTALLEILMRRGVIDADMINEASALAAEILVERDTTLANLFHQHAPVREPELPQPSIMQRLLWR